MPRFTLIARFMRQKRSGRCPPCISCAAGEWLMPNWHGQNTGQLHDSITVAFSAQLGIGVGEGFNVTAASAATNRATNLCMAHLLSFAQRLCPLMCRDKQILKSLDAACDLLSWFAKS